MTTISKNVQKKVNMIFWTRRFTSRRALECYVLFLSTLGLFSFVSVPHVIANMPKLTDIFSVANFMLIAATHTHAVVQLALALMAVSIVLIAFDFIRQSISHRSSFEHVTFS